MNTSRKATEWLICSSTVNLMLGWQGCHASSDLKFLLKSPLISSKNANFKENLKSPQIKKNRKFHFGNATVK